MKELREKIEKWKKDNTDEYYGLNREDVQAVLWEFDNILDKVEETTEVLEQSTKRIYELHERIEKMQKALEWYANEENYKRSENDVQTGYPHEIMWDKGIKARQALKHLGLAVEGIEN